MSTLTGIFDIKAVMGTKKRAAVRPKETAKEAKSYHYEVYGISLRSPTPLALCEYSQPGFFEIDLIEASASFFSHAIHDTPLLRSPLSPFHYAHFADGSSYVRWKGLGEFLVLGGGRGIAYRRFTGTPTESFQVYLLGQALSFALVKNGIEPLHATSIVIDGEAIVLLGGSGFGKSSLAACFLAAGYQLLTDDLLVLKENPAAPQGFLAYPGPPRIKLFPAMARRFLGRAVQGVPMNPNTQKLVTPLDGGRSCSSPMPVRAVYALVSPREVRRKNGIDIAALSLQQTFVQLLKNTFNYVIVDPARLQRQFAETNLLAASVPVKKLSYPRKIGALASVRDAILADMKAGTREDLSRKEPIVPLCAAFNAR